MKPLNELGNPLCTLCPLHENAKTICVMGNGDLTSKIMVIGEAPGANEDAQGQPFVGASGKILDVALAKAGLPREEVYVTNLVKCRPPGNRRPTQEEMDACVRYLIREYAALQPTHVLLLGNTVLHAVTSRKGGITTSRGYIPTNASSLVHSETFATFHPSAAARSKATRELFEQDIQQFGNKVRGSHTQA